MTAQVVVRTGRIVALVEEQALISFAPAAELVVVLPQLSEARCRCTGEHTEVHPPRSPQLVEPGPGAPPQQSALGPLGRATRDSQEQSAHMAQACIQVARFLQPPFWAPG